MNTSGFHHVAIICYDYDRSKKFYVEVLGFPIIQETFRTAINSYKFETASVTGF